MTLAELWDKRPCWICSALGYCAHRERDADQALIDRIDGAGERKPVRRETGTAASEEKAAEA